MDLKPLQSPNSVGDLAVGEALRSLEAQAGQRDQAGVTERGAIRLLHEAEFLSAPFDGDRIDATPKLLCDLVAIGAADLSIGRLYEGHVNAQLLVRRFGMPHQMQRLRQLVRDDGTFLGVWNTDSATPVTIVPSPNGVRLDGGKSFASGAGLVDLALITATSSDRSPQMLLVPGSAFAERIDRSFWHPLGMRASMSFNVDFSGVGIGLDDLLGSPGDYLTEPWFSGGAIRFCAVQLGGALAIARIVHKHLRATGREQDPYQIERFAQMRVALESGRLWLDRVGQMFDVADPADATAIIIAARMARQAIQDACHLTMDLAVKSVGVQGMLAPHPLERLIRDLTTYLRQPGPDASLAEIGRDALAQETLPWG